MVTLASGSRKRSYAVGDHLDGDRGQQQTSDPGDQHRAAVSQQPMHLPGIPQEQPHDEQGGKQSHRHGQKPPDALRVSHRQHRGHDRSGAGEHRRPQRHHRHVDPGIRRHTGLLADQQLQCHQKQQQATGTLQGRQADVQVGQDLLSEDGKGRDHPKSHQRGAPCRDYPLLVRQGPGQRQEDRNYPGRVHDHQQRHDHRAEQLEVEHRCQGRSTFAPVARSSIHCRTAGSVLFSPSRLLLPTPW